MSDSRHKVNAYERLLAQVKELIDETEKEYEPRLQYALDSAKEKIGELGEWTVEELDKVGDYLKRDIQDAASYLAKEESEFADWLNFEEEEIEDRLLVLMQPVVDHTKIWYQQLAEQAAVENIWLADEITGPGTLHCLDCGKALVLHQTSAIPVCSCGGRQYTRNPEVEVNEGDSD